MVPLFLYCLIRELVLFGIYEVVTSIPLAFVLLRFNSFRAFIFSVYTKKFSHNTVYVRAP